MFVVMHNLISDNIIVILGSRCSYFESVSLSFCSVCELIGDKQKETLRSRLWKWLYERFGVYIEDFRFQPEENTVETEEPLSAKR